MGSASNLAHCSMPNLHPCCDNTHEIVFEDKLYIYIYIINLINLGM